MERLKETSLWPTPKEWAGAVLFLETSEDAPSAGEVARWLRGYGAQGVLERASAIVVGRPGGPRRSVAGYRAYDDAVLRVVRDELGLPTPIITGMDFGHTDPMFVVPYGVSGEVDCDGRTFSIVESAVA